MKKRLFFLFLSFCVLGLFTTAIFSCGYYAGVQQERANAIGAKVASWVITDPLNGTTKFVYKNGQDN